MAKKNDTVSSYRTSSNNDNQDGNGNGNDNVMGIEHRWPILAGVLVRRTVRKERKDKQDNTRPICQRPIREERE